MARVAGLFAGIGGFEVGFEQSNHKTVLLCECDPYAKKVLKHRFREIELHCDVSELSNLPTDIEIVSAGFPCQNLSMAGDKSGIKGTKSNLVEELFRLLAVRRVPYVVIENVHFMLKLKKGEAIHSIINRLENLGYYWAYRVVDSRGFGLPQRRRRVFIVASTDADPPNILLADDVPDQSWPLPNLDSPIGFFWTEGKSGHGLTGDAIPPLKAGSGLAIPSVPAVLLPDGRVVTPPISAVERLQGFKSGWTNSLKGSKKERHRWRLLGNAVSVPVSQWIGKRLSQPVEFDLDESMPLDLNKGWPDAAWNIGKGRFVSKASYYPLKRPIGKISSFRTEHWPDLSERALAGFIRRAQESNLRYPPGFLNTLEKELVRRR